MEWKNTLLNYMLLLAFLMAASMLLIGLTAEQKSMPLLISSSLFTAGILASLIIYNKKSLMIEERYVVKFDEEFISCSHPEKITETVKWSDVNEIFAIVSHKTPDDPYFWVLLSSERGQGCMFPLAAKNSRDAIEKFLGYEGFDLNVWAEALRSIENKKYLVWKRK
ncbi:MAG: hypothetical protein K2X86_15265 [Cytophagaceae bacterium]|nr:hypothetical protein [Cytophagaceae bacterium]